MVRAALLMVLLLLGGCQPPITTAYDRAEAARQRHLQNPDSVELLRQAAVEYAGWTASFHELKQAHDSTAAMLESDPVFQSQPAVIDLEERFRTNFTNALSAEGMPRHLTPGLVLRRALEITQAWIDREPNSADAAALHARLLLADQRPVDAYATLQKALERAPWHLLLLTARADALMDLQRYPDAAEAYRKAARVAKSADKLPSFERDLVARVLLGRRYPRLTDRPQRTTGDRSAQLVQLLQAQAELVEGLERTVTPVRAP